MYFDSRTQCACPEMLSDSKVWVGTDSTCPEAPTSSFMPTLMKEQAVWSADRSLK